MVLMPVVELEGGGAGGEEVAEAEVAEETGSGQ